MLFDKDQCIDAKLCAGDAHAHMMMHDFYCEMFNDAAKDASASSDAEDAFNQTEFAVAKHIESLL